MLQLWEGFMKRFTRCKAMTLVVVFVLCMLVQCMPSQCIPVEAAGKFTISKKSVTLCVNGSDYLCLKETVQIPKWKSSNPKIVKVTKKGQIIGKKKGTATITGTLGKQTVTCKVKVTSHKCSKATCEDPKYCYRCYKDIGKPLGHKYTKLTCEKNSVCKRCGEVKEYATGHTISSYSCTEPRYCVTCGKELAPAGGHVAKVFDCTEDTICNICHEVVRKASEHTWREITCGELPACTVCKVIFTSALDHDWSSATCTTPAICLRCGEQKDEPLGHEPSDTVLRINGTKGNLESVTLLCARCSEPVVVTGADIPVRIRFQYRSTAGFSGENASVLQSVYSILDSIIQPSMSDADKVKAIHDYLIYNADYYSGDLNSIPGWAYAIQGVIQRGEGVCNSYALAFYLMCICEDIPCMFDLGIATNSANSTGSHAWNRVCLNGTWYYIDCTWDDPIGGGHERYDYYLSTSLWENHAVAEEADLARVDDDYWKSRHLTRN